MATDKQSDCETRHQTLNFTYLAYAVVCLKSTKSFKRFNNYEAPKAESATRKLSANLSCHDPSVNENAYFLCTPLEADLFVRFV